MPTMEMINDRFTRQQSVSWTSVLREKIEFSVLGTQIIKFGDFIQRKFPVPSSFNLFCHGAVARQRALHHGRHVGVPDRGFFFGGKVQTAREAGRAKIHDNSVTVDQELVQQALVDLEKAWQAVMPVKLNYLRSESNPSIRHGRPRRKLSWWSRSRSSATSPEMFSPIPSMLEPIKGKAAIRPVCRQRGTGQQLGQAAGFALQECDVAVTVQLGTAKSTWKT